MNIKEVTIHTTQNVMIDLDTTGADLLPGDTYVAKRNEGVGWLMFTCNYVDLGQGWVVPNEAGYWFDLSECHKVVIQ